MDTFSALDASLFHALNRGFSGPAVDQFMLLVSDRITWFVAAALLIVTSLVLKNKRLLAFCAALGITLGLVDLFTYQVLKPTFARPRPCYQFEADVRLVQERCGSDYGFPSNHAANSMATAVTIALTFRRRSLAITAVALAMLVGLSRIYLGVHFPGDVLAGFAVGGLLAWLAHLVVRRSGLVGEEPGLGAGVPH